MVMTTTKYGRLLAEMFGGTVTGAELYGKLRRLERRGARLGLRLCNGPEMAEGEQDKEVGAIEAAVKKLLPGCGLYLNLDPRGYALKISDDWMRAHAGRVDWMRKDWGGYGLLAPEIKLPTLSEIEARTLEKCPYFFTRDSMRFFGQTKRAFGVFAIGERVFIRAAYGPGKPKGYTLREYTGDDLVHVSNEEEKVLGLA